ncbi:hypothetical protein BDZ89DRAFT_1150995 [Hymenopellis radicata]|nr:hypothetical protein BDZ89DRAFT_1150995 [Hymenopellis radicata]
MFPTKYGPPPRPPSSTTRRSQALAGIKIKGLLLSSMDSIITYANPLRPTPLQRETCRNVGCLKDCVSTFTGGTDNTVFDLTLLALTHDAGLVHPWDVNEDSDDGFDKHLVKGRNVYSRAINTLRHDLLRYYHLLFIDVLLRDSSCSFTASFGPLVAWLNDFRLYSSSSLLTYWYLDREFQGKQSPSDTRRRLQPTARMCLLNRAAYGYSLGLHHTVRGSFRRFTQSRPPFSLSIHGFKCALTADNFGLVIVSRWELRARLGFHSLCLLLSSVDRLIWRISSVFHRIVRVEADVSPHLPVEYVPVGFGRIWGERTSKKGRDVRREQSAVYGARAYVSCVR